MKNIFKRVLSSNLDPKQKIVLLHLFLEMDGRESLRVTMKEISLMTGYSLATLKSVVKSIPRPGGPSLYRRSEIMNMLDGGVL